MPDPSPPMQPAPSSLVLPGELEERLRSFARAALPAEGCGCLVGRRASGGWQVRRVTRGNNLVVHRSGLFELDPGHVVRVVDDAHDRGEDLLGFWHSHPGGDASPSRHDAAMTWEGMLAVVVPPGPEHRCRVWAPEVRGWRELVLRAPRPTIAESRPR